jgi:Putative auto-transporter adhesin, head GIN domain
MKKHLFPIFIVLLTFCNTVSAQKKLEKIKGSKIVTLTTKDVSGFKTVEVNQFLEVYFVKNEKTSVEIEADDNLHEIISFEVSGETLKFTALKEPTGAKKFAIRVNYNDSLHTIVAKNDSKINALAEINVDKIYIKNYDKSQSFLNIRAKECNVFMQDKSKAELNIKADKTHLELSKDASAKALISSTDAKIDLYQTSEANIEGDCVNGKFRLDNNAKLKAKKFTSKNIDLVSESYTKAEVKAIDSISISASGKTEVDLYGEPKINIKLFTNTAVLSKKEK